ncbi:hypothetical protein BHM03_00013050 [Ensete ventricosum]|nr:hypothetical protein BHM03_00013050 [Ensete ventricosum]
MRKSSQDDSFKAKGKPPRLCQGHRSGSIPDCQHGSKKMFESEGSCSAIRANSSGNSSSPKWKKCIDVNVDRCNGFNAPLEVISLSKKSGSKRKTPTTRIRSEPEHIQMLRRKLPSESVTTVGISTSSSIHGSEKIREQSIGPQMKGGLSGKKSMPSKTAPVSDSYLALMKQCEALVKKLMSHQFAWVFDHPVDAVKLNIPDYHTIIKHPMDLGTIKSKLTSGAYSSPWGFASDVRLTFKNAMTYNPPKDDVHIMAVSVSKFFESRWKFIEKKLAAADAHIEKGTQSDKLELSKKRKMPSPDYHSSVPERKKSKMMDVEKQSLNRCLESLLANLSDHIIDFLRCKSGNMDQSIEEIKTHIDSFCDDTLFKLRTLLDNYIKEREVQQQVKTEYSDSSSGSDSEDEVSFPKSAAKADRGDPEQLQREREEIERQRRQGFKQKLRLLKMLLDELKQKLQQKLSAKESVREKRHVRPCYRHMEKTVEIDDYHLVLKDLEFLTRIPATIMPMSLNEKCTSHSLDDVEGFRFGGSNRMEQLGLFLKVYDEEDEVVDIHQDRKSRSSS